MKRLQFAALALALLAGCGGDKPHPVPAASPLARPVSVQGPASVEVANEPSVGYNLTAPSFVALPNADATFGRLGGAVFQIEMPRNWNHQLVVYAHGSHEGAQLTAERPQLRRYLIQKGYAWAASSYSTNDFLPGTAADESAAIWDRFVSQYGRPEHSYIVGTSLGGGAAAISAERYSDRYDGALAFCGTGGRDVHSQVTGDFTIAAAFAAGVTQSEWDASSPADLINARLLPFASTFDGSDQIMSLWIRMTGGDRPLAVQGFLDNAPRFGFARSFDNRTRTYDLSTQTTPYGKAHGNVPAAEFDSSAIRYAVDSTRAADPAEEFTGLLNIPLMTVSLTGDTVVPLAEVQLLRKVVDAAGRSDRLVQRAIQADRHCELTTSEAEKSFEALVGWADTGDKPTGEDLLAGDLTSLGRSFTDLPRIGSREADGRPSARDRVNMFGRLTIDGNPLDAPFLRVIVDNDGLLADCRDTYGPVVQGRYSRLLLPASELRGCGQPGSRLYLEAFATNPKDGATIFSETAANWPAGVDHRLAFDSSFSSSNRLGVSKRFTVISGDVLDSSGSRMPPGTTIDAYIGGTLCGSTSLSPIARLVSDSYDLLVVGPDSRAACTDGGTIAFRVNDSLVEQTAVNNLAETDGEGPQNLDLRLSGD